MPQLRVKIENTRTGQGETRFVNWERRLHEGVTISAPENGASA
jgi:hypothetical protein